MVEKKKTEKKKTEKKEIEKKEDSMGTKVPLTSHPSLDSKKKEDSMGTKVPLTSHPSLDSKKKEKEINEKEKAKNEKKIIKKKEETMKLSDLPGIGPAAVEKLESAGIFDLMGVAVLGPKELGEMAGLGEAGARKTIQAARKMMDLGFQDGLEFAEKRLEVLNITTGSKEFDCLLGGKGLETKAITEAFGAYGSGKTQLGLSLAVNAQLPLEQGGAEGKAVYIDTEGTFRPERIRQIAEAKGLNPESVLKNILVARAFNSDHQILLVDKVGELIKNGEPVRIVVIDSLTAHFRAEFAGRGQLADRQQKLNKYLHNLMKMAEQFNLSVYVTNQVMANPAMMFGDPTTAIGGNIVGHACLTGDSLIQLADGGIKEIKNMKQEEIMFGDFKDMKIRKCNSELVFVNQDVDMIYKINTTNQIKSSKLHRFFTINDFSFVEKEAKDLREEDFIAQAGKINIEGEEQKLPLVNVKKIGKLSEKSSGRVKKELIMNNVARNEICKKIGITPRQFRRVLNQSYPTSINVLNNLQNCFNGLQLEVLPVYTYKYKDLVIPQIMSSELAQICGYFLGDGNFEERGLRFKDERLEILNSYNILFKDLFKREGKITKVKDKNCFCLSINSKEISDFFKLIIPDVLDIVAKSKIEVVKNFIKGFVDAEGHIDKKRPKITVAQKEKQVLKYLQLFLLRFGIRSFLRFDVGRKKISNLSIRDRSLRDYLQIGFTALDKQEQLLKWINYINKTYDKEMMPIKRKDLWKLIVDVGLLPSLVIRSRPENYKWVNRRELENAFNALMNIKVSDRQIKQKIDFIFRLLSSDFRFEKIRKIEISGNKNKELFYDFSVPKNENYTANGFIVHNSTYRLYIRRGKKGSRVAKLIDSPNLPDNECVFFVSDKGICDEV